MSIAQVTGQERLLAARAIAALRSNAAPTAPAAAGAVARQPDAVTISDQARSLAAAQQATTTAAELRQDRISGIKDAIANGTYKVDSRTLATTLVENYGR